MDVCLCLCVQLELNPLTALQSSATDACQYTDTVHTGLIVQNDHSTERDHGQNYHCD